MAGAQSQPTEPLRPDDQTTQLILPRRSCRGGHEQQRNPTFHPTLGLVPPLTSVVIGGLVAVALLLLERWLVPVLLPWTIAVLAVDLLVTAIVQLVLGHRGWCFLWRSLRWWLGPIGSLIDPIEMG
jgi:hypothetical protein